MQAQKQAGDVNGGIMWPWPVEASTARCMGASRVADLPQGFGSRNRFNIRRNDSIAAKVELRPGGVHAPWTGQTTKP